MKRRLYEELGCFLAHALMLERESAERLYEIAEVMAVHNNQELRRFFSEMAGYSAKHCHEVEQHCRDIDLDILKPWEYCWTGAEAPETGDHTELHYLMTEKDALEYVLSNENDARNFYRDVQQNSPNEKISELAGHFAKEEAQHVALIEARIKSCSTKNQDWYQDIDPPNMPE